MKQLKMYLFLLILFFPLTPIYSFQSFEQKVLFKTYVDLFNPT